MTKKIEDLVDTEDEERTGPPFTKNTTNINTANEESDSDIQHTATHPCGWLPYAIGLS
jgi:hypothetical protein